MFWFDFAFLLFYLSSILIRLWTAICNLPALFDHSSPLPTKTFALLSLPAGLCDLPCLYKHCWMSVLLTKMGNKTYKGIFPSILPHINVLLFWYSKSLPLSYLTLSSPSPILSSGYQRTFWPFWHFSSTQISWFATCFWPWENESLWAVPVPGVSYLQHLSSFFSFLSMYCWLSMVYFQFVPLCLCNLCFPRTAS